MAKRYGRKAGMRRSYLKTFSAAKVNTGRARTVREYYQRIERVNNNEEWQRRREKEFNLDDKLDQIFINVFGVGMAEIYSVYFDVEQRSAGYGERYHHINPRYKAQLNREALEKLSLQTHHILIYRNSLYRLWLFFTEDRAEWFWYEQDLLNRTHRRSICYHSKQRAFQVRSRNDITWFVSYGMSKNIRQLPLL